MPVIGNYVALSKVLLVEGGKYFSLLLLVVLAIRRWQNSLKARGGLRLKNMVLAVGLSALAAGVGWLSLRNSMGKLYMNYARQACDAGRIEQANALFGDDVLAAFVHAPVACLLNDFLLTRWPGEKISAAALKPEASAR